MQVKHKLMVAKLFGLAMPRETRSVGEGIIAPDGRRVTISGTLFDSPDGQHFGFGIQYYRDRRRFGGWASVKFFTVRSERDAAFERAMQQTLSKARKRYAYFSCAETK